MFKLNEADKAMIEQMTEGQEFNSFSTDYEPTGCDKGTCKGYCEGTCSGGCSGFMF